MTRHSTTPVTGGARGNSTVGVAPLGETLIEAGSITRTQLETALASQRESGDHRLLGEVLVSLGFADEATIAEGLAAGCGLPFVRDPARIADPTVVELLSRDFARQHRVLPLFLVRGTLTIAAAEPSNVYLFEEIARRTGHRVQVAAASACELEAAIENWLPAANVFVIDDIHDGVENADLTVLERQVSEITDLAEIAGHGPVVRLVNWLIHDAVEEGASDIHVEPGDRDLRIRFRIDGRLHEKIRPPHRMAPAITSRIKIMAELDIAERRLPQDGDIHVLLDGRRVDLRVSTMSGRQGEKVVIRIIDSRNAIVAPERLGMSASIRNGWSELLAAPNGVVLVTGPTGSGKSTTLYSALGSMDADTLNLSTIEDPVEAVIPGVNQFQVNERTGFSFPSALRSMLRQDPDVVMVGEIRDEETAAIAAQAALTGHLVLSSLHTNDACGAPVRLVNLGVEPFLVATVLRGVLAQRLIRRICPQCRREVEVEANVRRMVEEVAEVDGFHAGEGCQRCRGTGFSGRAGVFELLRPDQAICDAISASVPHRELAEIARHAGFESMRIDGLRKVAEGLTTVEEVLAATAA
ncbi:MAG: Flp pilus assembly complex ATPase component [Phycisphaeraceae bacterium]|nr:Flp pilus assembly complex ATPase component [Phycisphaeraceae bacterium]MCP4795211.1 Flp pilus assembly complex ATPase component [Phycisphaeraceae bacterium]